jgi:hypothetical protein
VHTKNSEWQLLMSYAEYVPRQQFTNKVRDNKKQTLTVDEHILNSYDEQFTSNTRKTLKILNQSTKDSPTIPKQSQNKSPPQMHTQIHRMSEWQHWIKELRRLGFT